jgi:predicted RNA-binding protein with PUA-like domain
MKYWLVKSEPGTFSWDQQVKKGVSSWDGVRNHAAAGHLRAMKCGDRAFFYHSNEGKEIVGIVEVAKEAYPDPTDATRKFVAVDLKTLKPLPKPVTLAQIKTDKTLKDMALVRLSRLSVQPVTPEEWNRVCALGGI